jgi:uncharacterized repeat protein (TIGR01451 family)
MRRLRLTTYLLLLLLAGPYGAMAATNAVTAGIGGIDNGTLQGGDGSGAARVTITAATLPLIKQARDLSGNVMASGGIVARGQIISFVLMVTNSTPFAVADVQVVDQLNEAEFTYIPMSLETASVAAGTGDAALWGTRWSPLTDDLGGADDIASVSDSGGPAGRDRLTIGAVAGQANHSLSIPGATTVAVRFRVLVN